MEAIKRETELSSSKTLKRQWVKAGYSHQISLYGVLTNRETEASQYSRIEVLSQEPLTGLEVLQLYHFFSELKPLESYTIWIYSRAHGGVRQVGRYERRG